MLSQTHRDQFIRNDTSPIFMRKTLMLVMIELLAVIDGSDGL